MSSTPNNFAQPGKLGRLEKVDLRSVWSNEAADFTPWLADEENIALLGEAVGIDQLELESREKEVGPFSADILCKDSFGRWVLIENQLEKTDHTHLGQLITYAAGLKAVAIIWVAQKFREEHRAALDWLNAISNENLGFFGVEVELWRIGQSEVAPKFNVVSKPNNWEKNIADQAQLIASENLTGARQLQVEYWTALANYISGQTRLLKPTKPLPQNWFHFAIGTSEAYTNAVINTREKRVTVQLLLHKRAKENFKELSASLAEKEHEIGCGLIWRELPEGKQSYVEVSRIADPYDKKDWANQHQWLTEYLEKFQTVFSPRMRTLRSQSGSE